MTKPRGLLHNQCEVSGGTTAFLDVTEGKEKKKPASRMVLHKACYVNFRKFLRKTWSDCKKDFSRRYVASEGLTGRYVASGSKARRVLLVFVAKSQRKIRLRRNEKRFDEDSKENAKEDLSEALQVALSISKLWEPKFALSISV
ncbi:hypothetical protein F2Q69_00014694 [Brassica cretica]|uniref:Uncharacterized protein n=1 Tax=Brassica cretica TaxID=69181 RepID=A0A8S9QJK1_BRACR|nr:hypothetical protein F2Q69_00014694 [Brassica cretica]